jgi:ABC-2 type transport system ATP-binding protein
MVAVTLDGLTKRYGAHLAVNNVSFEVERGEIMGLLGPNGSGKTTILRILTGYLHPSAGTARVAGFDIVRDGRTARRRIGYVPENAPLYPHMRVNEFLTFMGRLHGLDGEKLRSRLAIALERLTLKDSSDTIIGRLSRGYRQRVSLAQAILHNPDLLVLDEPTNGLDPRQIIEFRQFIRGVAEQCAVVVTSHILGEIEQIADRVAILLQGRLLAVEKLEVSRVLRVRTRVDMAPRFAAVLRSTAGLAEVIEEAPVDNTIGWSVRVASSGAVDRLVTRLCAAGIGVVEIAEVGSNLERTFLALTSGKTEQL